eukprot:Seg652.9 transcript_id=Seg652.9/GoldUCD/mRNA.D3Y31 product="Zinc finger MYM-type protein 1" protein_id=Seg652.9/GoldUCD/D3Y31
MNYKDLAAGLITTHRVKLDREGGGGSEEELAYDAGRTAPTTVVVEEDGKQRKMETFFQPKDRAYVVKKRIANEANVANVESLSAMGESNDPSKKIRLEVGDGVADVLNERTENASESENDIDDITTDLEEDNADPAGLSDVTEVCRKKLSTAANDINEALGPKDLSFKDDQPLQPKNIKFPSHMIGRQYRAFVPSLYGKYSWLEYSKMEDAVYCDVDVKELDFGPSCGNFLAILALLAKHNPIIAEKIRLGPKNAKYTHHSVQNAILDIMKEMVLEQIKEELHEAKFFTVLADESKDVRKKEQVVIAVRYCHQNAIHEEFVGIAEAHGLDAEGLSDTIIELLQRINACMVNCVGQGYDGASVVSGHLNGVQRKLPEKTGAEMAYYVHCFCHRLNLVIVDVVKSIKCIADMISLFKSLHSFLTTSTVHKRWISIQEQHKLKLMEIGKVSRTKWSCQAKQFNVLWQRLDIVLEVLQEIIDNDRDSDRTTEADGFKLQIDRKFVRYLFAIKHILEKAKFASDILQKPTNDLTEAVELIGTLKEEIAECRSRKKCQEFWDTAEDVADRLSLPEIAREGRKKRIPTALQDYVVQAPLNETSISGLDGYVKDIYEIVDKADAELCKRFDEKNITMMRGITALCPTSNRFLNVTKLIDFAELFKLKPNVFDARLQRLSACWEGKRKLSAQPHFFNSRHT